MRVLSFVYHEFEDLELWYPILRLREEGFEVVLAGEEKDITYIGKYGVPAISDIGYSEVQSTEFDALLVPGGWAPDKIRRSPKALQIVQEMHAANKTIGQICHAGWVLISAKILKGYTVTSTPGIKDDMENAGGIWVDKPAVADRNIVSAQRPPDLPAYMKLYIENLKRTP
ncbi:MAG: type 1 glutamine amidotransferase [Cytophagales bacterium]|nr:type 1 glutamine amidotransferase [Cytophaga sp.]